MRDPVVNERTQVRAGNLKRIYIIHESHDAISSRHFAVGGRCTDTVNSNCSGADTLHPTVLSSWQFSPTYHHGGISRCVFEIRVDLEAPDCRW